MSRYYDPQTGRFINSDSLEYLDPETIGGLNLYAYCGNNPVMGVDPMGTFWASLVIMLIGGAVNALFSMATSAMSQGDDFDPTEFWIDVASGFVSGMISASPLGFGWQVVASGLIGLGEYLAHSWLDEGATGPTFEDALNAVGVSVVSSLIFGGDGANYKCKLSNTLKTSRRNMRIYKDMGTKLSNVKYDWEKSFYKETKLREFITFSMDSFLENVASMIAK